MTNTVLYIAILAVLILIYRKLTGTPQSPHWTGTLTEIRTDGLTITGDIHIMKIEIGQTIDVKFTNFKDRNGNAANIDTTSPVALNIEESDAFEVTPGTVTDTEANFTIKHIGTEEIVAPMDFTADGDTDSDEESTITVHAELVVDSPNAVSGEAIFSDPRD